MADAAVAMDSIQRVALPLHVQQLQQLLNVSPLLDHIEKVFTDSESDRNKRATIKLSSDVQLCLEQAAASDARVYNFSLITEERKWVQDLLLSDSEDSESELSESEQVALALELHYRKRKRWRKRLRMDPKLWKFRYFSAGLLMTPDHYPEHVKKVEELIASGEAGKKVAKEIAEDRKREEEHRKHVQQEKERYRVKLWAFIAKKEIPKMAKQFATARHNVFTNAKRVAQLCQREVKKLAQKSQRTSKEVSVQPRARRLMREALMYWRRYERTEKEQRRKAEREAVEQRKIDDEMREAKRQQRKLNFLITQTELYAHFMAKKLTGEKDLSGEILKQLDDAPLQRELHPGVVVDLENPGDYDSQAMKAKALANVEAALVRQEETQHLFAMKRGAIHPDPSSADLQESFDKEFSLATPVLYSERELPQPLMFQGTLKAYQLKGMNWLANLYDQGINGILADEMGLGKTVQTISLLAHLSERQGIWGPFLVVAPASTLHNWQQECTKFVPRFKVLPYWGNPHERKIIRKYWNPKLLFKESAPFHILITSYQLVVQDVKYFHRVKWQYMILDEAQAIKSSSSIRWKVLLSFSCRNRLLLTGTPIQNTMQELWALLHFIMPTMFDSHEEFNEWFSRDIESHAEKKGGLDENQLSRLHMILKPFMLRRIKRDVEHEMAEKIEVHLSCELSMRQKRLYHGLRQRISMEDLLQSSHSLSSHSHRDSSLLNLVMQFRKVCNHPDLFERRDVVSPLSLAVPSPTIPRLIYHQVYRVNTQRQRVLGSVLGVHAADHVHHASLADTLSADNGVWSFLRLVGICPREISTIMLGDFSDRLRVLMSLMSRAYMLYRQRFWQSTSQSRYQSNLLVLWPDLRVSFAAVSDSPVLQDLVFTRVSSTLYTHTTHRLFPPKTSSQAGAELTEISSMVSGEGDRDKMSPRSTPVDSQSTSNSNSPHTSKDKGRGKYRTSGSLRNGLTESLLPPSLRSPSSTPSSPSPFSLPFQDKSNSPLSPIKLSSLRKCTGIMSSNGHRHSGGVDNGEVADNPRNHTMNELTEHRENPREQVTASNDEGRDLLCMPTYMPQFLLTYIPSVEVPQGPVYCSERVAEYHRLEWLRGGPRTLKHLLLHGALATEKTEREKEEERLWLGLFPTPPGGLHAVRPPTGWPHIQIPDKENMIYDSGKMAVLDKLLAQLKREGHRVLVYSQMTRMIDLLEEFMAYRRHKFIRLDGSSRISDRRDMVDDFQNKADIFVFLLSTRAGGLGINLTAADTVIFYDSDWNPTVDQQAMDRAHRLGQTKQVTVYRLVVKGSIEERILQRAREKSEIQKMVISGGDFKPDTLKAKEMVSLLLDDEEMESRFLAKQAEKMQEQEQGKKSKGKKRKGLSNGRDNEPLAKKPNVSTSPSPLIFSSRPASVMSAASSEVAINGDLVVDVVGGVDATSDETPTGLVKEKHRERTSAPLGGRGKFKKKKGGGGGSMSAAASAGAMAGALAASNAAFATLGYSIPTHQVSPSPSNQSLSAVPVSAHGSSTQSSPRASPIPISCAASQTSPGTRLSVPRTLLTQDKNS